MHARRVAPAAVVGRAGPVGRARVGGGHGDDAAIGVAPARLHAQIALDLEARSARQPLVEHRVAQRHRLHSISSRVHVPIPASSSCTPPNSSIQPIPFINSMSSSSTASCYAFTAPNAQTLILIVRGFMDLLSQR